MRADYYRSAYLGKYSFLRAFSTQRRTGNTALTEPDIPTWLRRQLARRDWTAADLARRLDVPSARVSEWITGKRRPNPQTCIRLADAFDVDLDTVLAIAGHRSVPVPLDDPKADLIALISRADLSPEIIATITHLVRDFRRDRPTSDDPEDQSS
jgi:transcriptional regulator with XRE-family HTH domain